MLLAGGRHRDRAFLSAASVAAILSPAWEFDGANGDPDAEGDPGLICAYGLASQRLASPHPRCRDWPATVAREAGWVGHAGAAYGLRSGLWINPRTGEGIVYYATALGDAPAPGGSAFGAAEERLFAEALALARRR
jgi:hypothetical protein